jgi:predicted nucleic acid-binding protein
MTGKLVYLDSSAILKRYLTEEGSELVDLLYRQAERGDITLGFSVWNIGEVIGVLDRYITRDLLEKDEYQKTLGLFYRESEKHVKLGSLIIEPVDHGVLVNAWVLLVKYHIYVADALQLSTARRLEAEVFVSADTLLAGKAGQEKYHVITMDQELGNVKDTLSSL